MGSEEVESPKVEQVLNIPRIAWRDLLRDLNMPQQTAPVLIGSGQNNLAYDLGMVIVRVPRHPEAKRDLEREARIVDAVRPFLSTPVPAIELRQLGEQLVSVHPKLRGEPLSDLSGFSDDEREALAGDIASFIKELQAIRITDWHLGSSLPSTEWRELLARCEAQIFPIIPADRAAELRHRFRAILDSCDSLPGRITHGDFGTGNILIDRGRLSGVIDFAGCAPGDPAYDLASLAAGFGDAFCSLVRRNLGWDDGDRQRIEFYQSTFPLLDILHGIETGDREALEAGLSSVTRSHVRKR